LATTAPQKSLNTVIGTSAAITPANASRCRNGRLTMIDQPPVARLRSGRPINSDGCPPG
jgi:hypothetical protein